MKAIGYVRVSTSAQAEEGHSLAEQRQRIEGACAFKGIDEIEIVEDPGASGATLRRPGIQRVIEMSGSDDVDYVIVASLDRLTRSIADLQTLIDAFRESGVEMLSASESLDTSTAAGRMVVNIMAVFAQWEREAIGERVRNVQQALREQGRAIGPPPYGYSTDADGYLMPDPDEQNALTLMRFLKNIDSPMSKIAAELTSRGFTTRRGGAFTTQGVFHILKRHGA